MGGRIPQPPLKAIRLLTKQAKTSYFQLGNHLAIHWYHLGTPYHMFLTMILASNHIFVVIGSGSEEISGIKPERLIFYSVWQNMDRKKVYPNIF